MAEKMRFYDWAAALTPVALLAVIFSESFFGWCGWRDAVAASWAQAAFSVLAVFAAICVVWWQLVHAKRERRFDDIRKLHIIATSIFFCRVQVHELSQLAEKNTPDAERFEALRGGIEALKAAPIYESPSWHASFQLARITAAFPSLARQWTVVYAGAGANKPKIVALKNFELTLIDAEQILGGECRRLGGKMPSIQYAVSTGGYVFFGRAVAV